MTKAELIKALESAPDAAPVYCQHPDGGFFRVATVEVFDSASWDAIKNEVVATPALFLGPVPVCAFACDPHFEDCNACGMVCFELEVDE